MSFKRLSSFTDIVLVEHGKSSWVFLLSSSFKINKVIKFRFYYLSPFTNSLFINGAIFAYQRRRECEKHSSSFKIKNIRLHTNTVTVTTVKIKNTLFGEQEEFAVSLKRKFSFTDRMLPIMRCSTKTCLYFKNED